MILKLGRCCWLGVIDTVPSQTYSKVVSNFVLALAFAIKVGKAQARLVLPNPRKEESLVLCEGNVLFPTQHSSFTQHLVEQSQ